MSNSQNEDEQEPVRGPPPVDPPRPNLYTIPEEVFRIILKYLQGSVIEFSQLGPRAAGQISEEAWYELVKFSFGSQGLEACEVIRDHKPDASWRDCFLGCSFRKLVILGDLAGISEARPRDVLHIPDLHISHEFTIPDHIFPRDVSCGTDRVYVLGIEGIIWRFRIDDPSGPQPRLVEDGQLDNRPGPFTEILGAYGTVVAQDFNGDWKTWSPTDKIWSGTFGKQKVWEKTFRSLHSFTIALSECGKRILREVGVSSTESLDPPPGSIVPRDKEIKAFMVFTGPSLKSNECLVCMQVGECWRILFINEERVVTEITSFEGGNLMRGNVWKERLQFVGQADARDSYKCELVFDDSRIVHGFDLDPRHQNETDLPVVFSRQPVNAVEYNPPLATSLGWLYELTADAVYGEPSTHPRGLARPYERTVSADHMPMLSNAGTLLPDVLMPRANRGRKVNVPWLTNIRMQPHNVVALAPIPLLGQYL